MFADRIRSFESFNTESHIAESARSDRQETYYERIIHSSYSSSTTTVLSSMHTMQSTYYAYYELVY